MMAQPSTSNSDIFVFGSNLLGIHGAGAALFAKEHYGAEQGTGTGPTGRAYALPTKHDPGRTMTKLDIDEGIQAFLTHARNNPTTRFLLSKIGTGLAGYKEHEIAPFFRWAPDNVVVVDHVLNPIGLASGWLNRLDQNAIPFRVIVAGGREFNNPDWLASYMDEAVSRQLAAGRKIEVVSGRARGADKMGEDWAKSRGHDIAPFPAKWEVYKTIDGKMKLVKDRGAGIKRNHCMGRYAHALVAFWDEQSRGTRDMLSYAEGIGLSVRCSRY